ncbi:hypothetical protein INS49_009106 [Diaporthe citri]|uniref:uncharacterized protein n=1 Tax=Diaporthe citri TaxID=83186 RepID=UPI001C7E3E84|nr:uncharacterized protein INS49_009106 [Diaporthe citri]KAG6364003.1 hypothetical protein INS49_009106 [Diaporthe citri]
MLISFAKELINIALQVKHQLSRPHSGLENRLAVPFPPPDPKYSVMDITWAVESIPGNATSTVLVNGTVQEVYKRLTEINPDYDDLLHEYESSKATTALPDSSPSFDSMADVPSNCGYCNVCTKRWEPAAYMIILDGISYLNSLEGKPAIPPGPGFCSRVSCEYGASIWWCNDNDERKELHSWSELTTAAVDITRQCFWTIRDKSLVTGGQIFQPGGWNVVIRHDGSKGC